MSSINPYSMPPNPEQMVFPPGFPAPPPAAEHIVLANGYVFEQDREYPESPESASRIVEVFNGLNDSFVDPFQPQAIVASIDMAEAIIAGVELHMNNYRMLQGAGIRIDNDSRTVAGVLDLDFDISNKRILEYLRRGAKIGPYLMVSPNTKPFYSNGVGLWARERST